jgi:hypothetical protein
MIHAREEDGADVTRFIHEKMWNWRAYFRGVKTTFLCSGH